MSDTADFFVCYLSSHFSAEDFEEDSMLLCGVQTSLYLFTEGETETEPRTREL